MIYPVANSPEVEHPPARFLLCSKCLIVIIMNSGYPASDNRIPRNPLVNDNCPFFTIDQSPMCRHNRMVYLPSTVVCIPINCKTKD